MTSLLNDTSLAPAASLSEASALPNVVATAPHRIYLVIGEDCPDHARFSDLREVTWCADSVASNDIAYVRVERPASTGRAAAGVPPRHEVARTAVDSVRGALQALRNDLAAGNGTRDGKTPTRRIDDAIAGLGAALRHLAEPIAEMTPPAFNLDDPDLNELLDWTASMLLGPSNMDTALGWQDALDRVHARLSPVASGKEPTHG
jgi:hypothetical protein